MGGLIIVAGPTASGKSLAGIELATRLNAEIISVDSVQVYKGLDIGSAKPDGPRLAQVKHHMLDVVEAHEHMDAGRFVKLAQDCIDDISSRGKNIIMVGGTGLYFKALLYGLAEIPDVDASIRIQLQARLENEGLESLREQLQALDPEGAARIKPGDKQRTLRALEVALATGCTLSSYYAAQKVEPKYTHLLWGLDIPRPQLKERIALRAQQMWEQGLLREVASLLASGVSPDTPSLSSLGYRQAVAVLQGQMNEHDALQQMITRTQAYAKRQLTWFKAMPGITWAFSWQEMLIPSMEFLKLNNGYL